MKKVLSLALLLGLLGLGQMFFATDDAQAHYNRGRYFNGPGACGYDAYGLPGRRVGQRRWRRGFNNRRGGFSRVVRTSTFIGPIRVVQSERVFRGQGRRRGRLAYYY